MYSSSPRYALQVLLNPVLRIPARTFRLHALGARRARAEVDRTAAFRDAGLRTFRVEEQPARDAVVFAYHAGRSLRRALLDGDGAPATRDALVRFVEVFSARQALARRRGDRRLVHPDPRLNHVWVDPDGTWRHFDLESRLNPVLTLEEALARELECLVHGLMRFELVGPRELRIACDHLDPEVVDGWEAQRRRPGWLRSAMNRRRSLAVTPHLLTSAGTPCAAV